MNRKVLIKAMSVFSCCLFLAFYGSLFAKDVDIYSMQNPDDQGGGGGGGGCKPDVLVQQPNYSIIYNMKNKSGGLLAGCVKECGHTCTIKFVNITSAK